MARKIALALLLATWACATRPSSRSASAPAAAPPSPVAEPVAVAPSSPPDLFTSTVRPVLSRTCAPCHEPGGRMYDRLPFDNAEVVASHADSVLRRLKAAEDKEAVERWLATRPSS